LPWKKTLEFFSIRVSDAFSCRRFLYTLFHYHFSASSIEHRNLSPLWLSYLF
jgi:hypothetical protein